MGLNISPGRLFCLERYCAEIFPWAPPGASLERLARVLGMIASRQRRLGTLLSATSLARITRCSAASACSLQLPRLRAQHESPP